MSLLVSDDMLQTIRMTAEEFRQEIAILLFQQERFTLGQAAEFLGMSRIGFQRLLASRRVPIHYDVPELERDLELMKEKGLL